jgi:PAP2 superfamily
MRTPPRPRADPRVLTLGAPLVYAGALVAYVLVNGPPVGREALFAWLLGGMAAFSIASWRRWGLLLLEWLPFFGLLVAYDYVRGAVPGAAAEAHIQPQIDVDRALFLGHLPTVWLQDHLYSPGHVRPLDVAIWCIYLTHFFAVWVTAAVLWRVAHHRFRRYIALTVAVTAAALITYWAYPAQPPWLAAELGEIAPVDRIVPAVWGHLGVGAGQSLFENGSGLVNLVAAMPSLHASYPLMLLLFFWSAGWRVRIGLGLYTLAMTFALVYGGEHFVVDALVGWIFTFAAFGLVAALYGLAEGVAPRRAQPARRARAPVPAGGWIEAVDPASGD